MHAGLKSWRVAIVLLGCGVATASLAASPETGCPGSWTGSGEATFYDAFGQANACALPLTQDEYVVAVAAAAFDGSAVCGRCLRITGPLGSIVARITDYCVGLGCRDLDLSPNAFAAIGNPIEGIIPISWESVSCDVAGPIAFHFDPGSNLYYAKIQVRNHRYGIAGLAIAESGQPFVQLDRASDNAFESSRASIPSRRRSRSGSRTCTAPCSKKPISPSRPARWSAARGSSRSARNPDPPSAAPSASAYSRCSRCVASGTRKSSPNSIRSAVCR